MGRRRRGPPPRALILAFGLALGVAGCAGSVPEAAEDAVVTFAATKASGGDLGELVERYNKANPDAKVRLISLAAAADQQRTAMVQDLQAEAGRYDVLYTDAVWTAEFAARGWLAPLEEDRFAGPGILSAAAETGRYQGRLYAAPFATGTGMLFYRSDLVEEAPTSWAEMIDACAIAREHDMGCYAGQYARYEGLTVNATEAIASAGGQIMSPEGTVEVDSPEAREGLKFLTEGFSQGYIPPEAITYMEPESQLAFQQGDLLFMRNWAYAYPVMNAPGPASVVQGKFEVAPLPGPGGLGTGTLGGNNLAVSAYSDHKEEAKRFIEFMQSEQVQREWLLSTNVPTVREGNYTDPEVLAEAPFLEALYEGMQTVQPRPVTPRYNDVTNAVQKHVYAALTGEKTVDEAVTDLQAELERVVANS